MGNQLKGLTNQEVSERIAEGKVNTITSPDTKSFWQILASNIIDLPNMIIFFSVIALFIYAEPKDAVIISLIVVTNIIVSVYQEVSARNSLKKIQLLSRDRIIVIREGQQQEIDPEEVVADDLIFIESGKYVYVDGKVISEEGLLIDESILTGESDYSNVDEGQEILSGSFVVAGKGYYQAIKVGPESFINKITSETKSYVAYLSPLQKQVNKMLKGLTYLTIVLIAVIVARNLVIREFSQGELAEAIVSVISSMVPQGIVLTLTIAFMLGATRMGTKRIIVQKASTIETLAGIKYLCMDKTGTITRNILELKKILPFHNYTLTRTEEFLALYANLSLEQNKTIKAIGDALKLNSDMDMPNVAEQLPFTSRAKMSGLSLKDETGYNHLLFGSVESLIHYCKIENHREIIDLEEEYAKQGMRVLILLHRFQNNEKKLLSDDIKYNPAAIVVLEDRLREGSRSIMQTFIDKKVKPLIISGDHPETLKALIKQLNISTLTNITTGKRLAECTTETEFDDLVHESDIFARVSPEQKVEIIKSLQKGKTYVAMVGDGVNDALAIKQANLGIAMGSGANVTKNIADIILLDDNIASLADIVDEGRIILINTLRSAQLLIMRHAYSIIIIIGALLLGLTFPFYPFGLFLLAFTNGSIPVLAIVLAKPTEMKMPDFLGELADFLIAGGIPAGILSLILLVNYQGYDQREVQTMLLAFLTVVGVVNYLFTIKNSFQLSDILKPEKLSLLAPFIIVFYLLAMYIPLFSNFVEMTPLSLSTWVEIGGLLLIYIGAMSIIGTTLKSKLIKGR
ncbi:MAG: Calcium-transporting ATPase 1 [candidate division WS6 bacterium OLB21]|uniref:Calcium-transporting ATPase 1 n=1 Tax=candidate division WS6 bacterium OLB21 TaxID=1617427 RepID=A0A136KEH0_9BACT|nr:MAG: Calcium-transporting ATPase 1 [candidate division WS6 bacterium OLB21]